MFLTELIEHLLDILEEQGDIEINNYEIEFKEKVKPKLELVTDG